MERGYKMSPEGPVIKSVMQTASQFAAELFAAIPDWESRLKADPDSLEEIEQEVHAATSRGADMVICGLLSVAFRDSAIEAESDVLRRQYSYPLRRGRMREVRVRLLGGLIVWMCSSYCQPKRGDKSDEDRPGVYIDAAQFGIHNGVTPGLSSRVARQAALCPSLALAQEELARNGVELNAKTVQRIAYQQGDRFLRWRKQLLEQWRAGELAAGAELAGKRVAVQIDGGRTKIRGEMRAASPSAPARNEDDLLIEDGPGRSRKPTEQEYDADWREPKLLIIFVHDEHGKMDKQYQATIDGTFLGPDAVAELTAMHLHRLGAAQAAHLTFCADGPPWIWDRIPKIVELAGLQDVPQHEVLDNCHAAHHISLALAALDLTLDERMPLYREHRTRLRNGQWKRVVAELRELAELAPPDSKIHTEIAYLEKHGQAGRLNYVQFTKLGIPRGSGAIESTIRRVINLRLKSNSMFWRIDNAESMLQLRAQVISRRWDESQSHIRKMARRDARTDWTWEPRPMSPKTEANLSTSP